MRRRRSIHVALLATILGLALCPPAISQERSRALLGTWEGKVTFGESGRATLVFTEAAGALGWTYTFRYDPVLWGDAEGTVTSLALPALQLAGAWTKHAVSGAVGTKLRFVLAVDGDRMTGTVTAEMNNTPLEVSLVRKK
jgi:hypothetical protein